MYIFYISFGLISLPKIQTKEKGSRQSFDPMLQCRSASISPRQGFIGSLILCVGVRVTNLTSVNEIKKMLENGTPLLY
jgi:hypothetical protein